MDVPCKRMKGRPKWRWMKSFKQVLTKKGRSDEEAQERHSPTQDPPATHRVHVVDETESVGLCLGMITARD